MKNNTFASIESFTGGMFAAELVKIPGASNFFKGSLVVYSNQSKENFQINTSNGVINSQVALDMSLKGKEYFNVDYCFSFTGNAGPTSMEDKEIGLVFIGLNNQVYELNFNGDRESIMKQSVDFAFKKFKELLKMRKIS